ncbi:MAG: GNAT family N-acetyltransferase [Litorimonas sp.]
MKDILTTDRLTLRRVTLDDIAALSNLAGDYEIARMTGSFPHPFPPLSAEFRLMYLKQQWRRDLAFPYAITLDGKDLIGMADLFRKTTSDHFELGYWVGRPFWGQGYATEAASALIQHAQRTVGITYIKAGVFTDNPASLRVLTKLGFTLTGLDEAYFSMARMENAKSHLLELNMSDVQIDINQSA